MNIIHEFELARTHYERALGLKEDSPEAHENLAHLLKNHCREFRLAQKHSERARTLTKMAQHRLTSLRKNFDHQNKSVEVPSSSFQHRVSFGSDSHVSFRETRSKSRPRSRSLSKSKRKQVFNIEEFHKQCAYCGHEFPKTVDHVEPKYNGGSDDIFNLVPACRRCNMSKDRKNVWEWYRSQGFYTKEREYQIQEWISKQ